MKIDKVHIPDYEARGICIRQKDHSSEFHYCVGSCKAPVSSAFSDLSDVGTALAFECVEVRFKNNHKEFFKVCGVNDFKIGDIVAVEASPGHDLGIISLAGPEVLRQMKRKKANPTDPQIKKVYRKARPADIEKWHQSIEREHETMRRTLAIIAELKLHMKLNDVEFQGDGTKAIFYYTAEDRVDFRELIKILADEFRIRIEMRQIGARQESGKLGGIGTCGRELCCSSFIHQFQSVTTHAARIQQLSLNPQKLAGLCGKLKCCLNYEAPVYQEILKSFPESHPLKSKKGIAYHQKSDIFRNLMWYSYANAPGSLMALHIDGVAKVQKMNKSNQFPETLEEFAVTLENKMEDDSIVGKDDLSKLAD